MPRRISDPLNQGQTGKIYLQAYPEAVTGYKLAQKIYNMNPSKHERVKPVPPTSRVYTTLKSMREEGFVDKVENGFLSKAEPAATHISSLLTGTSALTASEEEKTRQILDSKIFRSQVALTEEFQDCSENGLGTVLRELGRLTCIALVVNSQYPVRRGTVPKEFQAYIAQSASRIEKTYEEIVRPLVDEEIEKEIGDKVKSRLFSIPEILSFVLETDKELLQKLVRLLSREDYLWLKQTTKLLCIAARRKE